MNIKEDNFTQCFPHLLCYLEADEIAAVIGTCKLWRDTAFGIIDPSARDLMRCRQARVIQRGDGATKSWRNIRNYSSVQLFTDRRTPKIVLKDGNIFFLYKNTYHFINENTHQSMKQFENQVESLLEQDNLQLYTTIAGTHTFSLPHEWGEHLLSIDPQTKTMVYSTISTYTLYPVKRSDGHGRVATFKEKCFKVFDKGQEVVTFTEPECVEMDEAKLIARNHHQLAFNEQFIAYRFSERSLRLRFFNEIERFITHLVTEKIHVIEISNRWIAVCQQTRITLLDATGKKLPIELLIEDVGNAEVITFKEDRLVVIVHGKIYIFEMTEGSTPKTLNLNRPYSRIISHDSVGSLFALGRIIEEGGDNFLRYQLELWDLKKQNLLKVWPLEECPDG